MAMRNPHQLRMRVRQNALCTKFGWDRPGRTMTFRMPDQNGDIGDDNKIIIELVKAPRRED